MQAELDLLGALVPAIAVWFVISVVMFVPIDAVLTRCGAYRLFWHPPLVRFALFVCLFCAGELAASIQ
jgi:protein AaeX